jgi:hypothetical protein
MQSVLQMMLSNNRKCWFALLIVLINLQTKNLLCRMVNKLHKGVRIIWQGITIADTRQSLQAINGQLQVQILRVWDGIAVKPLHRTELAHADRQVGQGHQMTTLAGC